MDRSQLKQKSAFIVFFALHVYFTSLLYFQQEEGLHSSRFLYMTSL